MTRTADSQAQGLTHVPETSHRHQDCRRGPKLPAWGPGGGRHASPPPRAGRPDGQHSSKAWLSERGINTMAHENLHLCGPQSSGSWLSLHTHVGKRAVGRKVLRPISSSSA